MFQTRRAALAAVAVLPLLLSAACGSSTPAAAKPQSLRTVTVALSSAGASNGGIYVAQALGYFRKQGIRIHQVHLTYASQTMSLLATNRVDVADTGVNPALFNGVAKHLGFKVVADKGSMPPGFGFTAIVVRKDLADQIRGPADLKGRTIALTPPGLGTSNGYAIARYLAEAHLTVKDVHIQPLAFPEQPAALANKAVAAAVMLEPFATKVVEQGIGVRLTGLDRIVPNQQVADLAYSEQFIKQDPKLARAFMVAYVQGIRTYDAAFLEHKDKTKILQILAKATGISDLKLWEAMTPAGLNPDGGVNVQSIEQQEAFFHRVGLVPVVTPATSFVDDAFVQYADKILGPAPAALKPGGGS